jgi:membrane associated rhomboid family serine protease
LAGRGRGFPAALVGISVFFVLITLGLQVWPGASQVLRFSRVGYEQGAFWQPLTSQWVHLSGWHAVANAAAFALIFLASGRWIRWPFQLLALCGGYAAVAVVVALDPNCSYYAGASGALHGLLAGNAVVMACAAWPLAPADASTARSCRLVAAALLSVMALKLTLQAGSAREVAQQVALGGWAFPVYHPAHVAGALGGVGLVLLVLAARALLATKDQSRDRQ